MEYFGNFWAYIAGMMDGDGSFSLIKKKEYNKPDYAPMYFPSIQLVNANEGLIDMFKGKFSGRKNVRLYPGNITKKPSYGWKIEKRKSCIPFLESVAPYLVIKKERAEFLLKFSINFQHQRGGLS